MKKLIPFILLTLLISSCNSFDKKDLLGEWTIEEKEEKKQDDQPPVPFQRDPQIIVFNNDGTYIYKNGMFNFDRDSIRYYGEKTQFKIKGDSLLIFNPATKKFDSQKIVELSKNKIVLETKKKTLTTLIPFKSKTYDNLNPQIDKIIVSKSLCFGTCPSNSTVIDNKGNFLFYGDLYNLKNGFFSSKISSHITKEIFDEMKYIDFYSLKPMYSTYITDQASSTITFISKGKIIKTVHDYGEQSAFELRRLIRNISYLYQRIPLQSLITDPVLVYDFNSGTKAVDLQESETFYLFSELLKAKTISQYSGNLPFTGKYLLPVPTNEDYKKFYLYERSINTDGKIFKIQLEDKTFKTVDFGYNFFDKNYLIRFKNDSVRAR
ncbi:DUF6438 domain-containing protein [Chryseobacterium sp. BIGb0232]|uniref:DUF6438 domain-containing protein n=1 Tax=Chryseobacterium sp. BIGb0232 TaxID=2940598 RepID=UPI000F4A94D5|nr:DUF6438 domain-containing protein [Chryseobacterium sp. BIGb0232]MCS4303894.1 hypothetical protein [Chryseobacterium sp. BIGb0232]